ncbi:RNA-binding protein [Methylicorpusculum oleiharenae]|uniref:RNA-binding S4 domain-containing protein n=1 Tax=Methylicorpusculum oleiharenae TaxID=1338687 RepID=UPI001357081C|nr:S4 domain-containing protein [Methylicorpusculum oleiharenae]MCD2450038.1 RNA-binding protein [Methylicorpusculum oleiharenae]
MEALTSIRLDKWLWAARFFKTRKLAAEAIAGGKVHLNNQRAKPGKEIGVGVRLEIMKDQYRWDIVVKNLNNQRRPAPEASLLYEETEESKSRRQALIIQQKEEQSLLPHYDRPHKPNKKERRLIHKFKEG